MEPLGDECKEVKETLGLEFNGHPNSSCGCILEIVFLVGWCGRARETELAVAQCCDSVDIGEERLCGVIEYPPRGRNLLDAGMSKAKHTRLLASV